MSLTGEQLISLIKELVSSNQLDKAAVAEIASQTAVKAADHARQWWDDRQYPHKNVFNPDGEKANPRPTLAREVFWLGFPLQESQMTREEIELVNRIQPGNYHLPTASGHGIEQYNYFIVREKEPGIPGSPIIVAWPCKEIDDQMLIARYDRGRGMVDFIEECFLRDAEEMNVEVPA